MCKEETLEEENNSTDNRSNPGSKTDRGQPGTGRVRTTSGNRRKFQRRQDEYESTRDTKQWQRLTIGIQYFSQLNYSQDDTGKCNEPPDKAPLPG